MSDQKIEEDRILKILKRAFAGVPCPQSLKEVDECGPLTHSEYIELRRDFYNYEPEEVLYLLPHILEELTKTRAGDDIETEEAEFLIFQLDPYGSDSSVVRKVQLELFKDFNKNQAHAICEWLHLARQWKDFKNFLSYVDNAISYWCQRASP
jgi:hypothetical protein